MLGVLGLLRFMLGGVFGGRYSRFKVVFIEICCYVD